MKTPYTPLLYSKTGVYRGIYVFLIFALKHRSWVLVRTTIPTIYVLCKNKENIPESSVFTAVKYSSKLHRHVCVMEDSGVEESYVSCCSGDNHFDLKFSYSKQE